MVRRLNIKHHSDSAIMEHELRHMLYTARMPLNASRSASNLEHLNVPVSAGPAYNSQ